MMDAPSAGIAEVVLDDTATLSEGRHRNITLNTHSDDSHNQMNNHSDGNINEDIGAISVRNGSISVRDEVVPLGRDQELFEEPIDSRVPVALDDSGMSEKPVLRDELERMEARIAEVRRQELGVDDRMAEIQREKDDLVETRAALEEAVNLMRQRLGRSAAAIVVQLATSRPARTPPAVSQPRRRETRPGSKRDQCLEILKPLFDNDTRSAGRADIKEAWLTARVFENSMNIESAVSGMLTHLKNYGYVTTDNRGTWTWIGLGRHENGRA